MSTCEHNRNHPEGALLPDEALLGHFLHCVPSEEQLLYLVHQRNLATDGLLCSMADHQGTIRSQARYTAKLLTGIRELLEELALEAEGTDPASGALTEVHDKLKALIS